MERLENQRAVFEILKNLRGLPPLKELFWTQLNYQRMNKPIFRKAWPENAANALAEDPLLLAAGGQDDGFHVIYCRLASGTLPLGSERPVVSKLLRDHPYSLFVFSNNKQDNWHFLNVKYDEDEKTRRLFRRITVGPDERLRTASERLEKIDLLTISETLSEIAPLAIQARHDEAFDVEPVTKEFFKEYGRIFDDVEGQIRGIRDAERKRLFTQRLFNRIMFIAFIEKKGWLKLGGESDYLNALWRVYKLDKTVAEKNFYRDRLKPLFFFGLNTTNEVNQVGINRGGFLKTLIGEVPYLNGGLFEEDGDDKNEGITIPDRAIGAVLNDLFFKFNFTVTESTPLDIEVAVDPEMLGKVFEEMVTGRHETGSYYTPKPIVSFMCREALKGYLETQLPSEAKQAIEDFVDAQNSLNLRNAEAVLEALRQIKVCDPACGSGAYLVGMLHELLDLRASLFVTKKLDTKSVYDRKLEIIQNNLYGVDLDPFAVNIARLRLWLSLAVDFEGSDPEPLPNLDYKVEVGDSLLGPNPAGGLELGFRKQLMDEFLKTKAEYLTAHHAHKIELRKKIDNLKSDIAGFSGHKGLQGFDWAVEFAEAFVNGGFDVALANPPYVRGELIKPLKPFLAKRFPEVFASNADLYCFFYFRGIQLLRSEGMIAFISSNKWLRAAYGSKLRSALGASCQVRSITDFGELPVFESSATFPMIFIARKAANQGNGSLLRHTQVGTLDPPYPHVREIIRNQGIDLSSDQTRGENWLLLDPRSIERMNRMRAAGIPFGEYVGEQIHYGIKTGFNTAFVINDEIRKKLLRENPATKEIIKPLAVGDDVRKWHVRSRTQWLIVTKIGVDMRRYPAIMHHLKRWEDQLRKRSDQGNHWWELRPCDYYHVFDQPKIVYPEIAKESRFALDLSGLYPIKTVFSVPTQDLFLLAILNSSPAWEFLKNVCTALGDPENRGRLTLQTIYVRQVPIPKASNNEKVRMASLAKRCVELEGRDSATYENEINEIASRLYGLD